MRVFRGVSNSPEPYDRHYGQQQQQQQQQQQGCGLSLSGSDDWDGRRGETGVEMAEVGVGEGRGNDAGAANATSNATVREGLLTREREHNNIRTGGHFVGMVGSTLPWDFSLRPADHDAPCKGKGKATDTAPPLPQPPNVLGHGYPYSYGNTANVAVVENLFSLNPRELARATGAVSGGSGCYSSVAEGRRGDCGYYYHVGGYGGGIGGYKGERSIPPRRVGSLPAEFRDGAHLHPGHGFEPGY